MSEVKFSEEAEAAALQEVLPLKVISRGKLHFIYSKDWPNPDARCYGAFENHDNARLTADSVGAFLAAAILLKVDVDALAEKAVNNAVAFTQRLEGF